MIDYDNNTKFTWGLDVLDQKFGKPDVKELIILFGYAAAGKTERAYFVSRKNIELGNKIAFISLELPEYQMKLRLARKKAGVSKFEFQTKKYTDSQKDIMNEEYKKIKNMQGLYITTPEKKDLGTIENTIRQLYDNGYRFFIIDNLDKIWANDGEDEAKRYQRITSRLQDIKNESDLCILLIHHAKKAYSKDQQYSEAGAIGLRGSQKIIDNATQVFEIWRDLDPDREGDDRYLTEIIQLKDTFEGANGREKIYFWKGEYVDKAQFQELKKEALPF